MRNFISSALFLLIIVCTDMIVREYSEFFGPWFWDNNLYIRLLIRVVICFIISLPLFYILLLLQKKPK